MRHRNAVVEFVCLAVVAIALGVLAGLAIAAGMR